MNSNELIEHIRKLNEQERAEHNRRREQALNKIKELRRQLKEKEKIGTNIHQ